MNPAVVLPVALLCSGGALAQGDAGLASPLSTAVGALTSVPIQMNYDPRFVEPARGRKFYANLQPVIPVTLNDEWNVISRTIVPLVDQDDVVPRTGRPGSGRCRSTTP